MSYKLEEERPVVASELPGEIQISSAMSSVQMQKYVDETIQSLKRTIQTEFDIGQKKCFAIIDSHPFYVLFEPKLGCNTNQDASVARSVLPIFKTDLRGLLSNLEVKISSQLEPEIRKLLKRRET